MPRSHGATASPSVEMSSMPMRHNNNNDHEPTSRPRKEADRHRQNLNEEDPPPPGESRPPVTLPVVGGVYDEGRQWALVALGRDCGHCVPHTRFSSVRFLIM